MRSGLTPSDEERVERWLLERSWRGLPQYMHIKGRTRGSVQGMAIDIRRGKILGVERD